MQEKNSSTNSSSPKSSPALSQRESEKSNLICAVDLGGTNLRAANIDRDGRIYERFKAATPEADKPEDIVSAIAAAVRKCEALALKRGAQFQAISVVVPGAVQAETGVVANAPNIPSLPGFRLAPALRDALDRPVLLENDANAAALGEMWLGAARDCKTIICLTLGTGVGGAIILDGKLWRGIDGTAGEIGHASVEPFGSVKCKCGNTGCLEVYASATAIVRMTCEGVGKHPGSSLHLNPEAELTSEKVYEAAIGGDKVAIEVFHRMGVYLGVAMANVANIFNPEIIVIGGGVASAWEQFAMHAIEEVAKRAFPVPAGRCRIVKAEYGDDAGLLGAGWLAFENKL